MKDDIIICRCEEVRVREIKKAILEGAITVEDVKRRTRAGMGLCQGKSCGKIIARLISQYTGQPIENIFPATFRPPVRAIKLGHLGGEENCCLK